MEKEKAKALRKFDFSKLSSKAEINDVYSVYTTLFEDEDHGHIDFTRVDTASAEMFPDEVGVSAYMKYTVEEMHALLGCDNDGVLPLGADIHPESGEKLRLRWHQLVGVASILDRCFFDEITPNPPGVLLADDVGLGKTLQVMGVISMIMSKLAGGPLPKSLGKSFRFFFFGSIPGARISCASPSAHPVARACDFPRDACASLARCDSSSSAPRGACASLARLFPYFTSNNSFFLNPLGDRKFFGGNDGQVPDLPFLILCPPGLVNQWAAELAPWFKKGAVDIFTYEGSDVTRDLFWTNEGPWGKSEQRPGHKILIAPFTVSQPLLINRSI